MNEELDELASAYVDGEASAEEIARVESDPELLSLVEEFRALRPSSLPAPQLNLELQEQHIASALAAFDEAHAAKPSLMAVADSPTETSTSDFEGTTKESGGGSEAATTVTSLDARRSRRRPPTWLLNAAAAVVVVGGVGFALTQLPDATTEDAAVETVDDAALEAEAADLSSASGASQADSASSEAADGTATQLADTNPAGEQADRSEDAGDDSADADDAEETGADEAMADESADDTGQGESESFDASEPDPALPIFEGTESASEIFEALGGPQAVVDGDIELSPPDQTTCFDLVDNPGQPEGFVFIAYGETLGLLLVFDGDEAKTPVLVDAACVLLSAD